MIAQEAASNNRTKKVLEEAGQTDQNLKVKAGAEKEVELLTRAPEDAAVAEVKNQNDYFWHILCC